MNQSKDQSRNAYAKELYGYHGKILNINLTDQSIQVEAPSPTLLAHL